MAEEPERVTVESVVAALDSGKMSRAEAITALNKLTRMTVWDAVAIKVLNQPPTFAGWDAREIHHRMNLDLNNAFAYADEFVKRRALKWETPTLTDNDEIFS